MDERRQEDHLGGRVFYAVAEELKVVGVQRSLAKNRSEWGKMLDDDKNFATL